MTIENPYPAGYQIFYAVEARYPYVVAQMESTGRVSHRINHLVAYSASHDEAVRLAVRAGKLWTSGRNINTVPLYRGPKPRVALVANVVSVALDTVRQYLPSNYEAVLNDVGQIVIFGHDNAGWTLDGFVIPRLASGLITAEEVPQ